MNKYLDTKYYCYNSITECLKHKQGSNFELKQMLNYECKLLMVNKVSGDLLESINDVQPLYLYPLSILDYCKLLVEKDLSVFLSTVSINIINFNSNINYIKKLSKLDLKRLSNIEIEINANYNDKELNQIVELMNYISMRNIKITLLFKTINIADELLVRLSSLSDFFKIMMPNILNTQAFEEFKNKLKFICSIKKETSAILVKSYLAIDQNDYYENTLKVFNELKIDIFQLSKELISSNNIDNPSVSKEIQDNIRYLENKYSEAPRTRFISVKDLTTLYYPRFELDERNSSKCYACIMKPYLLKDKFLPCRVNKVINNIDDWYVSNLDACVKETNILKCGASCDDCASMFENDILHEIENIIEKHKGENIDFILEMEG